MKSHAIRCVLLATAGTIAFAAPAMAQNTDDNVDANEIVVTAQNRQQDVNDVPIAINVVSGEELLEKGFSDMNSVDQIAPAVQVTQDQGTVKITLRGVGSQDNAETNDTSVVVNIDGEYINRPNVMGVAMFDIDRVEVLRGPQGTLYGRNSTGGAINFITRKPGNEFGANVSASYGNYNAIRVDAGVDVPMGENAGVRFAGFYDERDGYVSHPAQTGFGPFPSFAAGKSDDNKAYGGRVSLALKELGPLSINLAAEYAKREFVPGLFAYADMNAAGNGPGATCGSNGYERVAPANPNVLCIPSNTNFLANIDRSNYKAPNFGFGWVDQSTWALRGKVAYELSDSATLSYIAGYRHYDETSYKPLPVVYRNFTHLDVADTQSHELRLNGNIGGLIYQLGGFYFREELDRAGGFFLPIGSKGSYLSYFRRDLVSDSWSVFGQGELPVNDKVTLVGGLRYTKNKRDAVYNNDGLGTLFNVGPIEPPANLLTAPNLLFGSKEDKVTWLLGVNVKPNADTLLYAKASTGFKGGGFDAVGQYAPETNTAYEAGYKRSFGDHGQHQINLGAFYYDYRDLQVSVLLDTTVGGQTFNAGKATIWGLELESTLALDDNDKFYGSFNYLNAKYDELLAMFNAYCVGGCSTTSVGDLDPNTPGVQQPNFAGHRAAFSPEFVITVGYDHTFDLGNSGTVTASAQSKFKSEYFTDFFNYRDSSQEAFSQTDLTLTYKPVSKAFSVQAFVRNLEDVRPVVYGSYIAAGPDDIYNWQFGAPRTYGVRVSADF